ncbi:MAG: hypothetical protein IPM34_00595 [Saprospiraceae bacterium]|nr:hypothetical protein [Saprospiraceae bacterium]
MLRFCILFFLWSAITTVTGCQNNSETGSSKRSSGQSAAGKNDAANNSYLKLKTHQVIDRDGSGMVALTGLIPESWSAKDQLYWEYNDATLPIRYKGKFISPSGDMAIEIYPDARSSFSSGPMGTSGYPPPQDAVSGLKDFVQQNRGRFPYQILDAKMISRSGPVDQYVQGTAFRTHSQSAYVRIGYIENQKEMEEEFYGVLEVTNSQSQGVVTLNSIFWSATGLYSCKAPKGKLDKCRQIALTLKSSAKLTLPFYNKFTQVVQLLSDQAYQRIYAAGQISRIISQTNDQISKSISDSYWQTQKTYERTNQQFSDALRGVDRYHDGSAAVQLPSGYSNAWVNDRGEYLLGESSSFDPNQLGIGNWRSLERK